MDTNNGCATKMGHDNECCNDTTAHLFDHHDFEAVAEMVANECVIYENQGIKNSCAQNVEESPAACCNDVAFDGYMRIVADKKKDQINILKDQLESLDTLNSIAETQGNSQGSNMIIDRLNNSLSVAESARLLSVCRHTHNGGNWHKNLSLGVINEHNRHFCGTPVLSQQEQVKFEPRKRLKSQQEHCCALFARWDIQGRAGRPPHNIGCPKRSSTYSKKLK